MSKTCEWEFEIPSFSQGYFDRSKLFFFSHIFLLLRHLLFLMWSSHKISLYTFDFTVDCWSLEWTFSSFAAGNFLIGPQTSLIEASKYVKLIFSCSLVLNIWLIWHENFLNMGRKRVSFEWSSRLVRRMILHNQDCSIQRAKCSNFAASKINGGAGMVNNDGAVCSGMFTDLCGIVLMRRERMGTAWVLRNFPEINCIRHTSYMNSHNPREQDAFP